MIKKCGIADERKVLSYIGNNYPCCLYLFLDLKKYGIESAEVEVFIQEINGEIHAVLLKYYSCIHVYSAENLFDATELGIFIEENRFSMVYCTAQTAKKIYDSLPLNVKKNASTTIGWVAQIKKIDKEAQGLAVSANDEDFDQIVRMIFDDEDIGRSYNYDELSQQLRERNHSGFTRNIVIKDGDLVIAHACTNAEMDNIAVVAELLVHKDYRRRGYASEIWRDLCDRLLKEGKEIYSFYYSPESRALHKKVGFTEVCEWEKIVIA